MSANKAAEQYDTIIAGRYGSIAHVLQDYGAAVFVVYRRADYTPDEWEKIAKGNFRFALEEKTQEVSYAG